MGDLLGSLIWGAKSGQYCVIGGGSLHLKPLIYRLWKPKIESKTKSEARASGQEPGLSGRAKFFLSGK
jgi:hypothetical protein